jgi:Prokaryotic E2 family E
MLPECDTHYLTERGLASEVTMDQGMTCLIVKDWPLPAGLIPGQADMLLRLAPGYPDIPPDMWWFCPQVTCENGNPIQGTQVTEGYLGRTWQRWSRHLPPGVWRSGVDGLESFFAVIRADLAGCAGRPS